LTYRELYKFFEKELKDDYPLSEIKGMNDFVIACFETHAKVTILDNTVNTALTDKLPEIIKQLMAKVPIQYIFGKSFFYGLTIEVNPSVLIPRQETEELVDWIINDYKGKKVNILDVCTGSGCIALALKKNLPLSNITSIDISPDAINTAAHNSEILKLDIKLLKADALRLQDYLNVSDFDIIVSNPPYIPESEKPGMPENVINYEPHEALFVPDDKPLMFYEAIAAFAGTAGNSIPLYFEINESAKEEIRKMLNGQGYDNIQIRKDLNGKDRMVKAVKNGLFSV
jgi:release factor glutamine methyltransferase